MCTNGLMTNCPDKKADYEAANANYSVAGSGGDTAGSDEDIESRARAYFEINCAHCHNLKGNASMLDLEFFVVKFHEIEEIMSRALDKAKITGDDFRYIQTSTSLNHVNTSNFFKSTFFYLLLFLPIITIPVVIFINKKKEERDGDIAGNKQRKADRLAKKYLSEAQKELGNKEAFYEALERALHNYLRAKLGIETAEISSEKITELLQKKQVDNTSTTNFIAVLNDCDFARYTPITDVQMKEEYEKAKQVITQLDKQL